MNRSLFALISALISFSSYAQCPFDEADYLAYNPDVAYAVQTGAFSSGLAHYARTGIHENRVINAYCAGSKCPFIAADYLALNPDVEYAVRSGRVSSALAHYARYGIHENREYNIACSYSRPTDPDRPRPPRSPRPPRRPRPGNPTPPPVPVPVPVPTCAFNSSDYLGLNPDVAWAIQTGRVTSAEQHYYEKGGMQEGRPVNAACSPERCMFDEASYLAYNADVAYAVQQGRLRSGLQHYAENGMREQRTIYPGCVGGFVTQVARPYPY